MACEVVGYVSLSVVSVNQTVPPQKIQCESQWRISDLKAYLSLVYPTKPPVVEQRIIFSGKLLTDDVVLRNVFVNSEECYTVHLVHYKQSKTQVPPTPISSDPPATSPDTSPAQQNVLSGVSPDQLAGFQQEYSQYLQAHYMAQSPAFAPCYYGANWMMNPAWMSDTALYHRPMGQSQDTAVTSDSHREDHQQGDVNGQQDAVAAAEPVEQGGLMGQLNRMVAAAGLIDGEGGMEEGDGEDEGHPRDWIDFIYMLVRLGLLFGICYYYSSADKALFAFVILFAIYLVNLYRRVPNHGRGGHVPAVVRVAVPPEQQQQAAQPAEGSEGGGDTTQSPNVTSATGQSGVAASPPPPAPTHIVWLASGLRVAMVTSFQFVVTFFTSLIPEQAPPLNLN